MQNTKKAVETNISADLKKKFQSKCKKEGIAMSHKIEELIKDYIKQK